MDTCMNRKNKNLKKIFIKKSERLYVIHNSIIFSYKPNFNEVVRVSYNHLYLCDQVMKSRRSDLFFHLFSIFTVNIVKTMLYLNVNSL